MARCVAEGLAGVECLSGIPGSIGATPIQNVGAYGQEVAETIIVGARARPRARARSRELARRRLRLRLPLERVQAHARALGGARGDVRARAPRAVGPARLRRARAHARRRSPARARRSPTCARPCSALRRGKGMVLDPDDPDTVSAGSFFTNPILEADAFAALEAARRRARPPAGLPGGRRPRQDLRRLADRARRLPARPRRTRSGIAISSKHTLALTNRGAGTTAELLALAREIAGGVRERFGVRLEPEPTLVGVEWRASEHDARVAEARVLGDLADLDRAVELRLEHRAQVVLVDVGAREALAADEVGARAAQRGGDEDAARLARGRRCGACRPPRSRGPRSRSRRSTR